MKIFNNKFLHLISTIIFSLMLVMLSCILSFSTLQASENFIASSVGFEIYFVSSTKSQFEGGAKSLAEYQMARDGAGYIWKKDNYFYVVTSAYENKNDADLVSAKLKSDGEENEIIAKTFPALSLPCPIPSPEARSTLNAGLNIFLTSYRSLFDISVSLDTCLYDDVSAFLEINRIYAKASEVMNNFHMVFGECENKEILFLEESIIDLNESIGLLSENVKTNEKQTLISSIRYHYVEIIDIYNNFLLTID